MNPFIVFVQALLVLTNRLNPVSAMSERGSWGPATKQSWEALVLPNYPTDEGRIMVKLQPVDLDPILEAQLFQEARDLDPTFELDAEGLKALIEDEFEFPVDVPESESETVEPETESEQEPEKGESEGSEPVQEDEGASIVIDVTMTPPAQDFIPVTMAVTGVEGTADQTAGEFESLPEATDDVATKEQTSEPKEPEQTELSQLDRDGDGKPGGSLPGNKTSPKAKGKRNK